jgi:hypothetical protein
VHLPFVLDEAAEFIPVELQSAEVVIAVGLHPTLLAELPFVMGRGAGRALLVPREDPAWVRPGLVGQVTRHCARFNIETAFPKPFCSLQPHTPIITQFCEEYRAGRHTLSLVCDGSMIVEASCTRSSPCGLTAWATPQLVGHHCNDHIARILADLLHHRPCFGSMAMDDELGDTIMHKAMEIIMDAGREAVKEADCQPN